jgi:hypothetical protein
MSSKVNGKKFVYKEGTTKKHEVLKEAMKYLSPTYTLESDGDNPFICHCISRVTLEKNWNKPKDKTGLHTVIKTRLQGYSTFEEWLWDKHGITQAETRANAGRKLQATRKAWMQSMYEEFLAKDE